MGRRTQNGDLVEKAPVTVLITFRQFMWRISLNQCSDAGIFREVSLHPSQSLQRRVNGLDYRGIGVRFAPRAGEFSLPHSVQTDSGADPIQWVPGTNHLLVVPRIRMIKLYLHSPIHLHGVIKKTFPYLASEWERISPISVLCFPEVRAR
jgi:hypothetical protein